MNEQANMAAHYEHEIPEGYEARIEGNKVIIELKESEDERIRKEIMDFICFSIDRGSITKEQREKSDSWLAYLEEQKEQKPEEWNKEDKRMIDNIIYCLPRMAMGTIEMLPSLAEQYALRLKSLRPSWKPSELEKGALRTVIYILTEERNFPRAAAQLQNILNVFEGKESRKDWDPSEEQMEALKNCAYGVFQNGDGPTLRELYNDLKKL